MLQPAIAKHTKLVQDTCMLYKGTTFNGLSKRRRSVHHWPYIIASDEDFENFRDVEVRFRVQIPYDLKINLPSTYAISTDSESYTKEQLQVLESTICLVEK